MLDFLVELYDQGIGYSAINTARSALSSFLKPVNGVTFGALPIFSRFLKGVYETRPTAPRYVETWDVGKVLGYLRTIPNSTDVSFKDLTLKTVMLVSLLSAQRGQTIHSLNLEDLIQTDQSVGFSLSKPIKQSKPGITLPPLVFTSYPADPLLCVVRTLRSYIARTEAIRGQHKQLFISFVKPFHPVSRSTISRWIRLVMLRSGIDVNKFKPHSTRSASTSRANQCSVPLDKILATAGWSSATTFAKFYNKPIDVSNDYADTILKAVQK